MLKAYEAWSMKKDEKEKVGDMLVEFFESEMAIDDLIFAMLTTQRSSWEDAKDELLSLVPARAKMEFLKRHKVLDKKTAGLFQDLHGQRNKLAHPQGRKQRVAITVTDQVRKKFVKDCSSVLFGIYKAHTALYVAKEAEENKKREMAIAEALKLLSSYDSEKDVVKLPPKE